jgi:hypothetical protein
MAYVSLPKPDLEAHRNSLMLPIQDLIRTLVPKIGKKLTTYVASADNGARELDGGRTVAKRCRDASVRAMLWFFGLVAHCSWLYHLLPEQKLRTKSEFPRTSSERLQRSYVTALSN